MTTPNENFQVDETQDQAPPISENEGQDNGTGLYDQYLEKFPESIRPIATDVFKEWDANTTKRFQDLHSQYEPWKDVTEAYEPEAVQQAIAIAQAIETDPQRVWQALSEAYGFKPEQGPGTQQEQQEAEVYDPTQQQPFVDPRIDQLEQALTAVMQTLVSQREQETVQQQDAALDNFLTTAKQQYGEFDEDYVITKIANGVDPEEAVKQYQGLVQQALKQSRTPAPNVMGASGGVPSVNTQRPSSLDSKGTTDLVTQMLAQAAQARNQS